MKKLFFLILVSAVFVSCKKNEVPTCPYTTSHKVATASEITYLRNYLTANSITATQDTSGVFYRITNAGTGITPVVCSNISVRYTGSILGGAIFDSTPSGTQVKLVLGQLILGWQEILPILKAGGTITLYIPPSLGYGSVAKYDQYGNIVIPANSYLEFDIVLLDVQ